MNFNFIQAVFCETNKKTTENGALGYRTTGKQLLDINFMIPQLRNMTDDELFLKWNNVVCENPTLAYRWLFFLRDVRNGVGERQTFRRIIENIVKNNSLAAKLLIHERIGDEYLIPYYGRWDDLINLVKFDDISDSVCEVIYDQITHDKSNKDMNKPISLLAKWLPSINTSSKEIRKLAKKICSKLNISEKEYRKTLSSLRSYLDVVEQKMSANEWDKINYESVPSKANLKYANAFMNHDEKRRKEYLEALKNGKAKINSSVAFPHEIIHAMLQHTDVTTYDEMWKALPNKVVNPNSRTMVICDGSGSMNSNIPNSNITAMEVSNALAIYFAERLEGDFHNKFITFGAKPQFVDISNYGNIYNKYQYARIFNDCSNTNLEAVFDLILNTAIKNQMFQEDLPTNLLFISDMEFDEGVGIGDYTSNWYNEQKSPTQLLHENRLLDTIAEKYERYGYKIPRIIFWNVNSRSGTIPMIENDLGIVLISGYSTNLASMIMNEETDPYKCLVNQLMDPRYDPIENLLNKYYSK